MLLIFYSQGPKVNIITTIICYIAEILVFFMYYLKILLHNAIYIPLSKRTLVGDTSKRMGYSSLLMTNKEKYQARVFLERIITQKLAILVENCYLLAIKYFLPRLMIMRDNFILRQFLYECPLVKLIMILLKCITLQQLQITY